MSREETIKLLTEIAHLFPRFASSEEDKTLKIDLWTEAMEELSYADMHTALMKYTRSNNKGFAPSVGQLIELTKPEEDSVLPRDHVYFAPETMLTSDGESE